MSVKVRLNQRHKKVAIVIVFIAILVVGLIVFDDYGVASDDQVERVTTLANLKYIITTFAPSMELPDALASAPNLFEWQDRHYGVAAQIPSALVESAFGFDLYSSRIYKVRHLWVFIQFYIALILFYFLLKRRFRSSVLALSGVLILFLTPRIFADSFYNVKDSVFLSWGILSFYALLRWIERQTRTNLVLVGTASAVLINTRVIGALVPAIGLGILFLFWRRGELSARDWIQRSFILAVSTVIFWIVITPYAWHNPLQVLFETIGRFSSFPHWSMELYQGKLIANNELPWHYLPVWIAISMPTVTLIGWLGGVAVFFTGLRKRWGENTVWKWVCADGAVFIWGVLPIFIAILLGSTLYDGWRHFYFVVPTLVYFVIFGSDRVRKSRFVTARRIASAIVAISTVYQGVWMVRHHPFEMLYFSEWVPRAQRYNFDKDYWYLTSSDAVRWVLNQDANLRISVATEKMMIQNALISFPHSEAERLVFSGIKPDMSEIRYLMVNYSDWTQEQIEAYNCPGFEKVHELVVDGLPVYGIFQRITRFMLTPERVQAIRSDGSLDDLPVLSDDDHETAWSASGVGTLRLTIPNGTTIRGLTLFTVERMNGIPDGVKIMVSIDGVAYEPVILTEANYAEFFFEPVEAGYLRIESDDLDAEWYLSEIQVWKAEE